MKKIIKTVVLCFVVGSTSAEQVTILYTNDIESVYEPVASPWRDDMQKMGGMAYLSTLIQQQRAAHQNTLLVDAGDMFTGSLSKATGGKLVFDLYSEMGYDVGNLGNHEFEYGWQILREAMQRARFPVLNANIYYEGTEIPFARQFAILKAGDYRIGVVGLMGEDAFINTMMRSNRAGLRVEQPVEVAQRWVNRLKSEVDLMVLLTHQNRTAPMQTNKEADPSVMRGFDEDYALAGLVEGVDLIVGGHSDNGLLEPVVHPETGTAIVMTYGQGMHLGRVTFDMTKDEPRLVGGGLLPVNADQLPPNEAITRLVRDARAQHPRLTRVVGSLSGAALRRYYRESALGSLLADALKEHAGVDIAMIPAGAIRADLQAGEVTVEEILNVFPFTDKVSIVRMPGHALLALFEKGVSLDYGLSQFSGVELTYDTSKPVGERIIEAVIDGQPLNLERIYSFSTGSFTATGGEGYDMFEPYPLEVTETLVSDAFIAMFKAWENIQVPGLGRLKDMAVDQGQ